MKVFVDLPSRVQSEKLQSRVCEGIRAKLLSSFERIRFLRQLMSAVFDQLIYRVLVNVRFRAIERKPLLRLCNFLS